MKKLKELNWKLFFITVLRFGIGWHFLYEGITKLTTPNWTATKFLESSNSFASGFYHWMAASPTVMSLVDNLNIYGLILIGLGLVLGIVVRYACISGVLLLSLYYFAYPPFGASIYMQTEGSIFIVNKIFVEASILIVFLFLREHGFGIDNLIQSIRLKKQDTVCTAVQEKTGSSRREVLKNLATVPILGLLGWGAFENRRKYAADVTSGATIQVGAADLSELKGELPKGKIGKHEISRLVLGGNLIGGWAHSRDLIYASSLFKAYNTEKKIFETLMLAEKTGINTINIGFPSNALMAKYKKVTGSKIKVITQVAHDEEGMDHLKYINKLSSDVYKNKQHIKVRVHRVDKNPYSVSIVYATGIEFSNYNYTDGKIKALLSGAGLCHLKIKADKMPSVKLEGEKPVLTYDANLHLGACRAYRFKPLRIAYLTLSSDRGQGKSLQKA